MQDRPDHVYIVLATGDRELLEELKKKAGATSDADAFLFALHQVASDPTSEGNLILKRFRAEGRIRPIPRPQIQVTEALRGLKGEPKGGLKGGGTGGLGGF